MLRWYRDLIRLRKEIPELTDGRLDDLGLCTEFACLRLRRGRVEVVVNLGPDEREVLLAPGSVVLLASARRVPVGGGGGATTLGPDGVVVVFTGVPPR
jgi:maltooligosyltrehalose trehalohydrolase